MTGKHHYVEIVLSMMDNYYGSLQHNLLYDGKDKHKQNMANWALDAVIETTMKFTQNASFNNNL